MNDLIFMLIETNLTPTGLQHNQQDHAFVIVPNAFRNWLTDLIDPDLNIQKKQLAFVITRTLLSGPYILVALYWAIRASRTETPEQWLNYLFSTIAWF